MREGGGVSHGDHTHLGTGWGVAMVTGGGEGVTGLGSRTWVITGVRGSTNRTRLTLIQVKS